MIDATNARDSAQIDVELIEARADGMTGEHVPKAEAEALADICARERERMLASADMIADTAQRMAVRRYIKSVFGAFGASK